MRILTLMLLGFAMCCISSKSHAECGAVTTAGQKRGAALIFEGTVIKKESLDTGEFATTLKVHRVWKGQVPELITVYHTQSIDGPALEMGMRRIVFAVQADGEWSENGRHGTRWTVARRVGEPLRQHRRTDRSSIATARALSQAIGSSAPAHRVRN